MQGMYFEGTAGGLPVQVEAQMHALRVTGTGASLDLPYDRLALSFGGTNKSQLVCRCTLAGVDRELYVDRKALLDELGRVAPRWFVDKVKALTSEQRAAWAASHTILAVGGALLVVVGGFLFLRLEDLAVAAIPVSWEVALAESILEEVADQSELDADPKLVEFVETIGRRVLAERPDQPYDFKFHVARDDTVNAFAMPGGVLVVNAGLIAEAGSAEEVAGVIGHEIAHVLQRHSVRSAVRRVGLAVVFALIVGSADALGSLDAVVSLATLKFSRDHETEADDVGARLVHAAGIDPRQMADFFGRLPGADSQVSKLLAFASTHPASDERSARLRELVEGLPPVNSRPILVDWAAIQALAKHAEP